MSLDCVVRARSWHGGGDAAVDAAGSDDDRIALDGVEDVVAGQRASGACGEVREQAKFLGGELDFRSGAEELVSGDVEFKLSEARDRFLAPGGAAKRR
jgi:hypothetical protein